MFGRVSDHYPAEPRPFVWTARRRPCAAERDRTLAPRGTPNLSLSLVHRSAYSHVAGAAL